MFSLKDSIANQLAQAEMIKAETKANFKVNSDFKKNSEILLKSLLIDSQTLEKNYPQNHNALLNLIKQCENKIKT